MTTEKQTKLIPQEGFQEDFLASEADIVIGGGSAGGGKTFALLMEAARFTGNPRFGGVIFRRKTPQITAEGGLWDTSETIYPLIGATPKESSLKWFFPSSAPLKFTHLEYEKNAMDHQGAQYAFIGFDELTHFTKKQFFYLLTRNRSMCGIKPYCRATCNPDPDSWVAEFIDWWIDQDTGFPIPERDGVIRFFTMDQGKYVWGDSADEVREKCPHIFGAEELKDVDSSDLIKSVTFIRGSLYENKKLLKKDPQYLANLLSQDEETKKQLLDGNWKVRVDGLGLCEYQSIMDIFSNFPEYSTNKFITCDAARKGRDLAVIMVWEGFLVVKIIIFTVCELPEINAAIEAERKRANIPKSHVLVDQDGLGGGVVDFGKYVGFSAQNTTLEDPGTGIKENYKDLKTQCWYRMGDRINNAEIAISMDNIIVDGKPAKSVKVGKTEYQVKDLIRNDLKAFKREKIDMDSKKQINSKKQQKNILGGRSPDHGDTIMMREYFELKRPTSEDCEISII